MNVVLYTTDLEPITVVDLPLYALQRMANGERWNIDVPLQMGPVALTLDDCLDVKTWVVQVWAEPIRRGRAEGFLVFVDNDGLALSLRAEPLPGQRAMLQETYREGFVTGVLKAVGFSVQRKW